MDQWQQSYTDSAGSSRRYNGNPPPNQAQMARDYNGNAQAQPPAGFTYEQYQGGIGAHSHGLTASPTSTPHMRDGNGDVAMQDAGDPYSGMKYPMRPHHQQHLSGGRGSQLHSPQEPSAAAQRYSPMDTLSPSSPYGAPQQGQPQYGSRQSPTRPGNYTSPNSYYANRQQAQQLPPITPYTSNNEVYPSSATQQLNAVFGNDPKSPRRPAQQSAQGPPGRGPVPEFTKIRSVADLRPKVNSQPAFRRANPEGGFISVSRIRKSRYMRADRNLAFASAHKPPAINISHMQSQLQIRVLQKSATSLNEAKQGSKE
jgi:dual specificity protein kinase YAK1